MNPRFSILLPTHDRADVVGFAVKSVLAQTEPDFELLVVGDGCTDNTADVVHSFDDARIRWFDLPKAPNFGYVNRNIALHEACGELVAFMAHDDLWFPDHLELMGSMFVKERVEWAYSRPLWMDDDGTAVPFAVDLRRPRAFETFMTVGNSIPASCVVHRRSCLDRYSYWPEDVPAAGDYELWKRFLRPSRGANLDYVPTPTCIHFRAQWRIGPAWGPHPLSAWQQAAGSDWWPRDLRADIPTGALPQAHVWQSLAKDSAEWIRGMRDAVVDVIDGFAWDSEVHRERSAQESARANALEAALDQQVEQAAAQVEQAVAIEQRLAEALALNASIQVSRSWRVMAPARGAGRMLRRVARLPARRRPRHKR